MSALLQDLRYTLRALRKRPGFTAVAVITLALGIGVNTAVFSLADTVLLRKPPFSEPDRLAAVYTTCRRGDPRCSSSYPDYVDYRDRSATFADMAAYSFVPLNLGGGVAPRLVAGQLVTDNYFTVLGVGPAAGRLLVPGDNVRGAPERVAVVSHELWQGLFGSAPGVVGRSLELNGVAVTVVGVAPPGFHGPDLNLPVDVWLPMFMGPLLGEGAGAVSDPAIFAQRGNRWIHALIGRLAPSATVEQAQAEMMGLSNRMAEEDPEARGPRQVTVDGLGGYILPRGQERELVRFLFLLVGVVVLTLLLASANLANLLLARATARRREMGIRLAAGASRWRLARQLLTESATLAVLGGAAGLIVAMWTLDLLAGYQLPGGVSVNSLAGGLDGRVLLIAFAISLGTGILFGIGPAVTASRAEVAALVKGDDPARSGRSRLRSSLVAVQMALCLVLLIGAGLFVRTVQNALAFDPGFDGPRVALARFNLALLRYPEARAGQFIMDLVERVERLPGVEAAGLSTLAPLDEGGHRGTFVSVDGYEPAPDEELRVEYVFVTPAYFRSLGIPIRSGRSFGVSDDPAGPPVVLINETMASRYWAGKDPVGGRISFGGNGFQVVGVAADVQWRGLLDEPSSYVFLSLDQFPSEAADGFLSLTVRTAGDPNTLLPALRAVFGSLDPRLSLSSLQTMDAQLDRVLMPQRFGATLLTLLATLGIVLASVGVYGVVAHTVGRETRNVGIRMALGATTHHVIANVSRGIVVPILWGIGAGVLLAYALGRSLETFLFGVSGIDPFTFGAVIAGLVGVAAAAVYLPARRAAHIDPTEALRHE